MNIDELQTLISKCLQDFYERRVQMVRLAIADKPYFKLSTLVPHIPLTLLLSLRVSLGLGMSHFLF